jgi:uncharacterized protein
VRLRLDAALGSSGGHVVNPKQPAIFHLSFPVRSLEESTEFYRECLGATIGRRDPEWADVILFGHQITLHNQPGQVLPREQRGVRHFGAILGWSHWEDVRASVLAYKPSSEAEIQCRLSGEPGEHVKLLLEDPDGNVIEIKAYKEIGTVIAPQLETRI